MESILLSISEGDGQNFQAFINAQTALDQYSPAYLNETTLEYTEFKQFSELRNASANLIMGSVIEKNADKPIQELPNFGKISGSLGRMGDRFQWDNDKLERYLAMERRLRRDLQNGRIPESNRIQSMQPVARNLFEVGFKMAAYAPHLRLDHLWFQGYTLGEISITLDNNPKGVQYSFPTGVKKRLLPASAPAIWGQPTATPLMDIKAEVNRLNGIGKRVTSIEMNTATLNKMVVSNAIVQTFTINNGNRGNVKGGSLIGVDVINTHLQINGLPTITLKDNFILNPDRQSSNNSFEDDRVVFITNNAVKGKVLFTDPLEAEDPHPNKVYSYYRENLLSQYRTEQGRFIEYEMFALPVFTGEEDIYVLNVGQKSA